MRFRIGDDVIQINRNYGTSMIGWKGTVKDIRTNSEGDYTEVSVKFKHPRALTLTVFARDLKLITKSYIAVQPKNKRGNLETESGR